MQAMRVVSSGSQSLSLEGVNKNCSDDNGSSHANPRRVQEQPRESCQRRLLLLDDRDTRETRSRPICSHLLCFRPSPLSVYKPGPFLVASNTDMMTRKEADPEAVARGLNVDRG